MMSDDQHRNSKLLPDRKVPEKVHRLLQNAPFRNPNWGGLVSGDVRLVVVAKDGFRVSMDVHKSVLAAKSRFFAEKLRKDQEVSDRDDVEAVVLMYYDDLKRRLMGEEVSRVLGLLKVSAAIMFDEGITSCMGYLEAVPWSEEEEEKVVSQLGELQLHEDLAGEVLLRVLSEPSTSARADDIFMRLLTGVLQAKDYKARREIKTHFSVAQ